MITSLTYGAGYWYNPPEILLTFPVWAYSLAMYIRLLSFLVRVRSLEIFSHSSMSDNSYIAEPIGGRAAASCTFFTVD